MSLTESLDTLHQLVDRMIWAEYEFVSDPPERMMRQGHLASPVWRSIEAAVRGARSDVVMHAAYFIPQTTPWNCFERPLHVAYTCRC